ncbi:MAG: LLM class flavin-dependent oxidoreductase [Acidimicrobiales bacterium]
MKIGWWDHFEQLRGVPLAQQYDERLQLLQIADAAGFHGYHIAEHHLTPLDMAPSPLMFLTAAARVTEQIRLGTLVLVLPLYHPVRLLQELYMLDHLSHGRLMPGVGKGVRDVEHEWFGHDQSEVRDRFDECLAILQSALATDRLDFHGVLPLRRRADELHHDPEADALLVRRQRRVGVGAWHERHRVRPTRGIRPLRRGVGAATGRRRSRLSR